mgnify:CR=1 FL=1
MSNNSLVDPCVGCRIRLNAGGTCGDGCLEYKKYKLWQERLEELDTR